MENTNKIKKFEINGRTIIDGYCSCLKARVEDKLFSNCFLIEIGEMKKEWNDATLISLTEDKVIYLINEAEKIEILEQTEEDKEKKTMWFEIETKTHKIYVEVKRGD